MLCPGRFRDQRELAGAVVDDPDVLAPGRCGGADHGATGERRRIADVDETEFFAQRPTERLTFGGNILRLRSNRLPWRAAEFVEAESALRMRPLPCFELTQKVGRNLPPPVRQARRQAIARKPFEAPDIGRHAL